MYERDFVVAGTGRFPMDMLRYDACFPINEEQARAAATREDHETKPYYVKLRTRGKHKADVLNKPCAGRWSSFGWTVVNVYAPMKVR